MTKRTFYLGIDLGTTNSAAAVFDGDTITLVRNSHGMTLTPSVVRLDARGNVTVGVKAQKFLESDPNNTRAEYKRLMGTQSIIEFPSSQGTRKPEELAAEILRSLRTDVKDQLGFLPDKAVISVPALFELPQSAATTTAAKLAGFTQVELIQEPIASALAAGWTQQEEPGYWLVYDLGGGTFDISLLHSEEGRLRVVGHDGDNFLGGRDFDWAIVGWLIESIAQQHGVHINRSDVSQKRVIGRLKQAAEEAKIELSRNDPALISIPELVIPEKGAIEIDLVLDRKKAEELFAPLIERTLQVCHRLCQNHHVEASELQRIVLVGGPTMMPGLRAQVEDALKAPLATGLDPMTLVAQGAAIYAATSGLEAQPVGKEKETDVLKQKPCQLWLQYPAMCSDKTPHVVGKVVSAGEGAPLSTVRFLRQDGLWQSDEVTLGAEGDFVTMVELLPRHPNFFRIEGKSAAGQPVFTHPETFSIVHGMTLADPPLSRTIGVALANDTVQVYFEKGTPLPAKRTFVHHTVEGVTSGYQEAFALKIPIVQGEYEQAHLCRLVGTLEISNQSLSKSLATGAKIEVTLFLDRSGQLSARAFLPQLGQVFEQVVHLLVPDASPAILKAQFEALSSRVSDLHQDAFRQKDKALLLRCSTFESNLVEMNQDIQAGEGGDADAAQKARRNLLELDAALEQCELDRQWPEVESDANQCLATTSYWLSMYGTVPEQNLLLEASQALEDARKKRRLPEIQRQLRLMRNLRSAAYYRDPESWKREFESAATSIQDTGNFLKAQPLIQEGWRAIEQNNSSKLQQITRDLWKLLPADAEERRLSYESGIR